MILPSVRNGLQFHRLDDELLVYDQNDDVVHLLNDTTARVLNLLREGKRTSAEIEAELTRLNGDAPGESLLLLAVDELRKANLLDEGENASTPLSDLTRREMLRKATMAGAATLLIPAIMSLSPRRAYGQTSAGVCREKKECCTVDADCCSEKCDGATTNGCTTGPLECH